MQHVRFTWPNGTSITAELPTNEALLYRELAQPRASAGIASAPVAAVIREALNQVTDAGTTYDDLKVEFVSPAAAPSLEAGRYLETLTGTALTGLLEALPPGLLEHYPELAKWPALVALYDLQQADDAYRRAAAQEDALETLARLDELAPHHDFWGWVQDMLAVQTLNLPLEASLQEARLGWIGALAAFQTTVLGASPLTGPVEVSVLGDDLVGTAEDMGDAATQVTLEPGQEEVILWRPMAISEDQIHYLGGPSELYDAADFVGDDSRPEEGGYLEVTSRLGFVYPRAALYPGAAPEPVAIIHRGDDEFLRVNEAPIVMPEVTVVATAGGLRLE